MLQPGSHEVIFRFKPRMFTIGHFVDLTSSLLILLLLMGACYTGYSALRRDEKIKEA